VSHATAGQLLADRLFGFVAFTGSVRGGHEVYRAATAQGFAPVGLELGGTDAAIVLADCDFDATGENVVDGAFYNSGQSCCAIERVFVEASIADRFAEACAALVSKYVVGDPFADGTQLGPVVDAPSAARIRAHVAELVKLAENRPQEAGRHPYVAQAVVDPNGAVRLKLRGEPELDGHMLALVPETVDGTVVGWRCMSDAPRRFLPRHCNQ